MNTLAPTWIAERLKFFADPLFTFDEKAHLYAYCKTGLTSITTWFKDYTEPFIQQERAEISAYYRGCTVQEILDEWEFSRTLGTVVHKFIEDYLTAFPRVELISYPVIGEMRHRSQKFHVFAQTHLQDFIPISLELRIFLLSLGLAGTLDALLWHVPTQTLWVFDWKTNGKILTDKTKRNSRYLNAPFLGFFDHEHNKYSIQISWYRRILAAHGIKTAGGVIVHIPPGDEPAYMLKARDFVPMLEAHFPC